MPTVAELRARCKKLGIKGYQRWNKAKLMRECGTSPSPEFKEPEDITGSGLSALWHWYLEQAKPALSREIDVTRLGAVVGQGTTGMILAYGKSEVLKLSLAVRGGLNLMQLEVGFFNNFSRVLDRYKATAEELRIVRPSNMHILATIPTQALPNPHDTSKPVKLRRCPRHIAGFILPRFDGDLDRYWEQGSLNLFEVAEDMLGALNAVHKTGYLYVDMSPGNILVDMTNNTYHLTDFGLVEPLEYLEPGSLERGTLKFSAISMDLQHKPTVWADFESLGYVLGWLLLNRHLPWDSASTQGHGVERARLKEQWDVPPVLRRYMARVRDKGPVPKDVVGELLQTLGHQLDVARTAD